MERSASFQPCLKVDSHITSYMDDKFCKFCDVAGCNNRATEIIQAQNTDGYFTFNICSLHITKYRSDNRLGKPFNLKCGPVRGQYN